MPGNTKPSKRPRAKRASGVKLYKDVSDLPDEHKKLVDKLLLEGAPFEDVVDAVKATNKAAIDQRAVERYFRNNVNLQKERVFNQREMARKLAEALGDKESAQADLAFSVLVMGLSGLNRRNEAGRLKQAMATIKEQKGEFMKQAESRRKDVKLGMAEKALQMKLRADEAKLQATTLHLDHLRQSIERQGKDKTLGPEIIQQINEIYGIVTAPSPEEISDGNYDAKA
jgi:hypothetical protein